MMNALRLFRNQELQDPTDEPLSLLRRALETDVPLTYVLENIEKAILEAALHRHKTSQSAYGALKIPKTSFFSKKRKYFH
ncbi:MAG: hypothetical protein AB7T49_12100 [Oligoflexales bacterium]